MKNSEIESKFLQVSVFESSFCQCLRFWVKNLETCEFSKQKTCIVSDEEANTDFQKQVLAQFTLQKTTNFLFFCIFLEKQDFELKIYSAWHSKFKVLQSVRFWIRKLTTRQDLKCYIYNASESDSQILQRAKFWIWIFVMLEILIKKL